MCVTLLTNIGKENGNEKYRKVNTNNERLKQTIFLNEHTKKLVNAVGFISLDGTPRLNKVWST